MHRKLEKLLIEKEKVWIWPIAEILNISLYDLLKGEDKNGEKWSRRSR